MGYRKFLINLFLCLFALCFFLLLPSHHYHPDGLRVLPSLHQIIMVNDSIITYTTRPVRTSYQPDQFFFQNLQKHLLFPLYAHIAFRIARIFGYQKSGLKPLQTTNAIFAALTVFLFALILTRHTSTTLSVIFSTIGFTFTNAFLSSATNITEVIPSLPFFLFGIYLIMKKRPLWAGVLFGISSCFYLFSLIIATGIGFALIKSRQFRSCLTLILTSVISAGLSSSITLDLSGYHRFSEL
ncbi:MAG: hypothetical protein ACUVUR_02785, partial [bacterium]